MISAHSAANSKGRASDSSIEVIKEHQATSHCPFTRSQLQTPTFAQVHLRLRMSFLSAPLKPSRIPLLKIGSKHPAASALSPVARIQTPLTRLLFLTSGTSLPCSSSNHARMVSKRPLSPLLDPEPSKRVHLPNGFGMGDISHRQNPTGNITSILVPRRQGWIPLLNLLRHYPRQSRVSGPTVRSLFWTPRLETVTAKARRFPSL